TLELVKHSQAQTLLQDDESFESSRLSRNVVPHHLPFREYALSPFPRKYKARSKRHLNALHVILFDESILPLICTTHADLYLQVGTILVGARSIFRFPDLHQLKQASPEQLPRL